MIPIRNIYYMLAYAFQVLHEQGYKAVSYTHLTLPTNSRV